jgi:hypothetical protein
LGKIEEILEAIRPLDDLFKDAFVTCDIRNNQIEVLRNPKNDERFALLFHSEDSEKIQIYFLISPFSLFLLSNFQNTEYKKMHESQQRIVLSGKNVFYLLKIEYTYHPKGTLSDIHDLSMMIKENSSKIFDAFSDRNIEKTYNKLKTSKGNKEAEITNLMKNSLAFNH